MEELKFGDFRGSSNMAAVSGYQKKALGLGESIAQRRDLSTVRSNNKSLKIRDRMHSRRIWKVSLSGKYPVLQAIERITL